MDQNNQTYNESELNISASIPGVQQDFQLLPLSHLMAQDFPPAEWLVEGLIPEDAVVLLSAPPSSLKTWFTLEIMRSVASGAKFLDFFTTKKTNVLIMDAESGERQLHDHFKKLHVDSELGIYYSDCCGYHLDLDTAMKLETQCYKNDIRLVVFDSLVRFHNSDENSAKEMSKVFEGFAYLKKCGITSLIICHTRKNSNSQSSQSARGDMDAIRGSSDILASCDVHLAMSRPKQGNKIIVKQTKNRLDTEFKPFTAYFTKENRDNSSWSFGEILEDREAVLKQQFNLVIDYIQANPGKNQKQILNHLQTCNENRIHSDKPLREILNHLEKENIIYSRHGKGRELLYYAATVADTTDSNEEPRNV